MLGLAQRQFCYLTILEVRSVKWVLTGPKTVCPQCSVPLRLLGKNLSHAFPMLEATSYSLDPAPFSMFKGSSPGIFQLLTPLTSASDIASLLFSLIPATPYK